MQLRLYIISFLILVVSLCHAQQDTLLVPLDTIPSIISQDSLGLSASDSIPSGNIFSKATHFIISKDSLEAQIQYGAEDTMWFDRSMEQIHLYGNAFVNYQSLSVEAGYIVFNFNTNVATAESIQDSSGQIVQKPRFKDGEQEFEYKRLKYNFKSKKGLVYHAVAKEGQLYVRGDLTKFVSKDSDSLLVDDHIYNKDAIVTSCDAEIPHFGIRTKKLKVIPDKLAIIGPARLEIASIPTPLWLPFGFFPIMKEKSSGLIFPKDYEYSPNWGYGLRNIGYYFPINDYLDLKVMGDIYLRGSWGLNTQLNYNKRYKYKGNFNLGFTNRVAPDPSSPTNQTTRSYSIKWAHRQDPKAHPYQTIGGSIDIESNGFSQLNSTKATSQLNNTLRSNLNYQHSLPGTPFSFSSGISHSQNLSTKKVEMTLPDMNLNMNRIYPFQKKIRAGSTKWYEKIGVKYDTRFANYIEATDTTFYSADAFKNAEYGMKHNLKTDASFRVLKYFNFTPNAKYDEVWYFKEVDKSLDGQLYFDTISVDTTPGGELLYAIDTTFGKQTEDLNPGFNPYRNFSTGASLSTSIFGVKQFSKGWFRGIRHVVKPSVSFTYSPENESVYTELVDTDLRDEYNDPEEYTVLPNGVFGRQNPHELQQSISFSVGNNLDMKYFSRKDSTERKLKLINSFSYSGRYNFAADSFKMSLVSFSGTTRIFNGHTNVSLRGNFDPYDYDDGKRQEVYMWESKKLPLRFNTASLEFRTSMSVTQIRDLLKGKSNDDEAGTRKKKKTGSSPEGFLDLLDGFSLSHNFSYRANYIEDRRDTFYVSLHTLNFRGNIPLTKNWRITVGNFGYDFVKQGLSYPDFGFSRDLHCWEMRFNWQPRRGTYTFFIGVKDPTLNFIKTNYNKNNYDSGLIQF